jgi:thiamine biosynthesis lipoprotein ApbE
MKINRILLAFMIPLICGLVLSSRSDLRVHTFNHEQILGTSLELKVVARATRTAARAEAAALAEIERQADILSSYDATSEFSRWFSTRNVAVPVSPELFEVLSLFDAWRALTSGALDASAEAASRVWKTAAARQRLPSEGEIAAAVFSVRQTHWSLRASDRSATHLSDAPLVLSSFTKSYVLDRAARAVLAIDGVSGVVVNVGGDLVVRGDWTEDVTVANPANDAENAEPLARLAIRDRAVATSGSYRRGVEIDGRHYSHIVDPRTGRPAEHIVSATVVASDAATAGALATAFSVLRPEESQALAATMPEVEYLLVERDGARIQSAAWHTLESNPPAPARLLPTLYAAEQSTWNPAFELTVSLELARVDGFGGKRPYVAVWIEDQDRLPVRTLALWFQKSRWLPDLKSWYRGDRLRALADGTELVASVSSATRPAGKYSLVWDGKDNQGKPVKAGVYTVCIEAAREHGTYQIIRQEMDFSAVPTHMDLSANVEIASASLDYHKLGGR